MAATGTPAGSTDGGRVRAAAATIEGIKRGRTELGGEGAQPPASEPGGPEMAFDAESNTMVPSASLPEDKPATKSHVMGLLDMDKKDFTISTEKATEKAIKASRESLKAEIFEHVGQLLSAYDAQSQKRFKDLEGTQTVQKERLSHHDHDIDTL